MKLAVKITVIGILVMALVIGSMLFISVSTFRSGLEEEVGKSQLLLAENIMGEVDRVLHNALQDIRAMAEDEEFEETLSGNEDFVKSQKKLEELQLLTGPWEELDIYNKEGVIVVSSDDDKIGGGIDKHDGNEKNIFNAVINSGENYVSDLVIAKDEGEPGKPTIIFAAPVRDETVPGQPIVGVVIGKFAWPVIEEILQNSGVEVHLYNQDGFLIADSGLYHQGQILHEQVASSYTAFQHALEGQSMAMVIESVIDDPEFHHHEEVLTVHVPQQGHLTYQGSGWVLLTELPTSIAFTSATETTQNLLIAGLLLLILTVLVAFFVARSISKPLLQLQESAQRISRGNFSEKIEVKTGDEIGELAETFDNMRYSLKMVVDEYEKMKAKEEMVKKVKSLEKKQAQTIKKLRIAISEQKIASAAEQKALQKYREMQKKTDSFLDKE
jgi:methyl-accepting chemotaxis protein